ncbi:MAG TPA: pullulanase-type alpha-1,6-glucosidase [Polyangiaceae bacterium]|nr:pullulanase-type alpha-1,6-glucosidase [Polyangiaceae bacterium]
MRFNGFPKRSPARGLPAFAAAGLAYALAAAPKAGAQAGPAPSSVTMAGSFQSELGCPADWQPECATPRLNEGAADHVWRATFTVPAGAWQYKAALDGNWTVNYGAGGQLNGPNLDLSLAAPGPVRFYYSPETHWVTNNVASRIVTAAGSFQSELGCPGDWQPECLRSWLQDVDGDGVYTFTTSLLPAGSYEVKATIDEGWAENYGENGVPNGPNVAFTVPSDGAEVFFRFDSATNVLTVEDGGPKGNLTQRQAHWVSADTLAWALPQAELAASVRLHFDPAGALALTPEGVEGGESLALERDPAGLPAAVVEKFPHLASYAAFKIAPADLERARGALGGRLAVSAAGEGGALLDATGVQTAGVLDDLYTYDGPLGVEWRGKRPALHVWAPTARSVKLHLFDGPNAAEPFAKLPMGRGERGVWSIEGAPSWGRKYYLYEVEVYVHGTARVEHNLVTDPYSLSVSANGLRSQIVDLDDQDLKPAGWAKLAKPRLDAPEDAALYELHVRDFSIADPSVPADLRGTFAAFGLKGSLGMKHLRGLAEAGLTHVHLLPAFDFATVEERRALQAEPEGDLSAFAPDSPEQQARVAAVRDRDGFNWGYDPLHYTVPEGSYATDPDGPRRVKEFRTMVKGLNEAGLRAVMDVVYNHTSAAGQSPQSVLDRVVPGYYHRLDANGSIATSTCCQNTATEHAMMEKLMVDSIVTWARAYKVDGFRFDLMGHHMKRNLLKVRGALDALTPAKDGVDGTKIYVYGEGWNFGEVADGARGVNATQLNMPGTGIGTFSDRLRDAARGGNPFGGLQEQGFINGLLTDPNGHDQGGDPREKLLLFSDHVRLGLAANLADYQLVDRHGDLVLGRDVVYNGQPAGYALDPQEIITYVSAHDNETLFDAIQAKAPASATLADRVRMNNLGLSLVGLGQGIPFFHAGDELLRSKSFDRNSYNSGDWFNALDFTYESNGWGRGLPPSDDNQATWPVVGPLLADPALAAGRDEIMTALAHFRETLRVRKSTPLLRLRTGADVKSRVTFFNVGPDQRPGLVVMAVGDPGGEIDTANARVLVVLNADVAPADFHDDALAAGDWRLHPVLAEADDPTTRTSSFDAATGTFFVPGRTTAVFWVKRPAAEQVGLVRGRVDGFAAEGRVQPGLAKALQAKLAVASLALEHGLGGLAAQALGAAIDLARLGEKAGLIEHDAADDVAAMLKEARAAAKG